jgi:predicted nucleotidyltransferase component of viral defense system
MIRQTYKNQVALLIRVIPEIAKETCFALHGGTAINLFIRDIPRLSVDIDLTYIPLEDRATSMANISLALQRIQLNIEKVIPGVRIDHKKETAKLLVATKDAGIKIEVNSVIRGTLSEPQKRVLSAKAQKDFEAFCAINVIPLGQLYGGKIYAAMDRQHPRDLFDVKYLLVNEGFNQEVKEGFLLRLLSGERPIGEVLYPNFLDQRLAMENQFSGMTEEDFSYEEYEAVREKMVNVVQESLTQEDKKFILSLKNLSPDWNIYNFEKFPAVNWKLQNLQKLKGKNPSKFKELFEGLEQKLIT